jgi:hypothetical protein
VGYFNVLTLPPLAFLIIFFIENRLMREVIHQEAIRRGWELDRQVPHRLLTAAASTALGGASAASGGAAATSGGASAASGGATTTAQATTTDSRNLHLLFF